MAIKPEKESTILPSAKIHSLIINQTGFVLDPQNGHSFLVNETGIDILKGLHEGKDFDSIKQRLLEKYEVQPETVDACFTHFLNLVNRHL